MVNRCPCPNPPGGEVVCDDGDLAICRVVDGQAYSECVSPPRALTANQLSHWVLEEVTGIKRPFDQLLSPADRRILQSGLYRDDARGLRVTFTLPSEERGGRAGGHSGNEVEFEVGAASESG